MSLNVELLRSSFELVAQRQPKITPRFYELLFERYPQVKPLFGRNAATQQQEMLQEALVAVLDHIEDASWLEHQLGTMGAKHLDYGVTNEMYDWVGECLVATLAEVAGDDWNDDVQSAWIQAYGAIASLMQRGAANATEAAAAN